MTQMIADDGPLYGPTLMAAHRLTVARELIAAHDAGEAETPEQRRANSGATGRRASNLAREYADLVGIGRTLSGREMGESHADYRSASAAHAAVAYAEAVAHARAACQKA